MNRVPQKIGSILQQLLARRGYAQIEANHQLEQTLRQVLGETLAGNLRLGTVRRGVLTIFASDSTTLQEVSFQQRKLLHQFQRDQPESAIKDVRFRVQSQTSS